MPPPRLPAPPNPPPPAPWFPPIPETLASRLLYVSLAPHTAELLREQQATGWAPTSIVIMDSLQGHPDTTIVEGFWFQEKDCADGASPYDEASSRGEVAIGQLEDQPVECVHAAPYTTREMLYRNKQCVGPRTAADEGQQQKPLEFQARCVVVLIEDDSRKALFDRLLRSGRKLDEPLRINVTYTRTRSPNPDFNVASMNCAIGELIRQNHERDAVDQHLFDELEQLETQLEQKTTAVNLFAKTLRGLSAYRPPNSPPPPSPPPRDAAPPGMHTPPFPPAAVSLPVRLQQLQAEEVKLQEGVQEARALIASRLPGRCVPSATNVCGRRRVAAPHPWRTEDGSKCIGYDTLEAMQGSFCAHWGSPVRCHSNPNTLTLHTTLMCVCAQNNVDAAEPDEAEELLTEAPPWCFAVSTGAVKSCSPVADRVARSGVYELQVMLAHSFSSHHAHAPRPPPTTNTRVDTATVATHCCNPLLHLCRNGFAPTACTANRAYSAIWCSRTAGLARRSVAGTLRSAT